MLCVLYIVDFAFSTGMDLLGGGGGVHLLTLATGSAIFYDKEEKRK